MNNLYQINFLSKRRKRLRNTQKKDVLYAKWSGYIFFGVCLVFVGVFITDYFFEKNVTNILKQQDQLEKQIAGLAAEEIQYRILSTKIRFIEKILGTRKKKRESIAYFTSLFDDGAFVKEILFDDDNQNLSFVIQARDIFAFTKAVDLLRSNDVQEKFGLPQMTDLTRKGSGEYTIQVVVPLSEVEQKGSNAS